MVKLRARLAKLQEYALPVLAGSVTNAKEESGWRATR